MIIYVLLLILSSISLFAYKKTGKRIYSLLPYIFMAFVSGFRNNVGVDYNEYTIIFSAVSKDVNRWRNVEVAVRYLIYYLNRIGATYQVFFLFFSVLTSYFYYKFIKENSKDFILSTIVYLCIGPFYLASFNTVRQALAASIIMYSLRYCYSDKKKYFFLVLFASLFHISAIIFILMPLTELIKNHYGIYTVILSSLLFIMLKSGVLQIFLNTMNREYSSKSYWNVSYGLFLLVSLIVVSLRQINKKMDKQYVLMFTLIISLTVSGYLYQDLSIVFVRLLMLETPVFIIVVPEFVRLFEQKNITKSFVYTFCIIYYFLVITRGPALLPFSFNFNLTI